MSIYTYQTEPLTDFNKPENIKGYQEGLSIVQGYMGNHYDLIINGKRIKTEKQMESLNPSNFKEVVGTISQASIAETDLAIASALSAFETWKYTDAKVRADVLFKSAAILRRRKFEFSALMTKEAGKPWPEADADVAEAIDFLEYYGIQMLSLERIDDVVLSRRNLERNQYKYK